MRIGRWHKLGKRDVLGRGHVGVVGAGRHYRWMGLGIMCEGDE